MVLFPAFICMLFVHRDEGCGGEGAVSSGALDARRFLDGVKCCRLEHARCYEEL